MQLDQDLTIYKMVLNTPCIPCTDYTPYPNGYGRTKRNGIMKLAHRAEWEDHHGPIPEDLKVCHKCDNRICRNIEHLFLGTQAENLKDMRDKGRGAKENTHGRRVLNREQVATIKARIATGKRGILTALAKEYGVSQPAISLIKSGQNWPEVEELK